MTAKEIHHLTGKLYTELLTIKEANEIRSKINIAFIEQFEAGAKDNTDSFINSLGEPHPDSSYEIVADNGEWWLNHKQVGSGEPLRQALVTKKERR